MTQTDLNDINEYVAALEKRVRRLVGDRSKAARLRAVSVGVRVSAAPYGYDLIGKRLVPNDKADVVKSIFCLRAENAGYQEIADHLNGLAIPSARGKMWKGQVIRWMLANRVYGGETVYQPWDADEPVVLDTPWTRIIDADLFEEVQQRATAPIPRRSVPAPYADRRPGEEPASSAALSPTTRA